MIEKKLYYGVRLTVTQLKYLRTVDKPSEWIREAVDEKKRHEEKLLYKKFCNCSSG